MQFNTIFNVAILAATVSAVPAPVPAVAATADAETALHSLSVKKAAGCSVLKCVTALAPTVVACAAALAEEGVNVVADYACFAAAANAAVNPPSSCNGCL